MTTPGECGGADAQRRALAMLTEFRRRLLPGALRRMARWKGLHPSQLLDQADDIAQELALDCLGAADELLALDEHERHRRWLRRAEAVVHEQLRHVRRWRPLLDDDEAPKPAPTTATRELPEPETPTLQRLANGRINLQASVHEAGVTERTLRRRLDDIAHELGWDDERRGFWQRRVAEALTGLAADLLQRAQALWLLDERLPPPDPERRRQRLRALARRLPPQPYLAAVRRALAPWRRRQNERELAPDELLALAVELAPDHRAAWLWRFEARAADLDVAGACHCLRRARHAGGERTRDDAALLLARVRLLELADRPERALRLLERRCARAPTSPLLRAAQRAAM